MHFIQVDMFLCFIKGDMEAYPAKIQCYRLLV